MHYAVAANQANTVKLLLDQMHIEVNLSDNANQTPLDLVQQNSSAGTSIYQLLRTKGAQHRSKT